MVPGISRSRSLPDPRHIIPPQSAQNIPLAPIFGIRRGVPSSEPVTRSGTPPPTTLPAPELPTSERLIPEREAGSLVSEEDTDLDGSGIGEPSGEDSEDEDDTLPDEDDVEDPGDSGQADGIGSAGTRKRKRIPTPEWLEQIFKNLVAQCKDRNHLGQPRLYYQNETFWFPTKSTYFLLQKLGVTPEKTFNPRFFLWDPLALFDIPCPNCGTKLQRHTHISRPRRVISFNSVFWMIGFRYRCMACSRAKPPGQNVTFRSWDPRIVSRCSPELAAEFPARLSHRTALDVDVLEFMRSCFQTGMGSKQFSDALRVQHLLRYDKTHLQYLQHLAHRVLDRWRNQQYDDFLPFDNRSPRGHHGYVPSGEWLRDMYDRYIEEHGLDFDQFTALLSAEVNALDHSHKVSFLCATQSITFLTTPQQFTKHLIQLNGERVFTGLLTVTNEKGEIRVCCLVATKAHSQFELALQELSRSLDLYGMKQPLIFYTDNMSDRQFLTKIFPSLSADTSPVEKYQHLQAFTLPNEVAVSVHNSSASINAALQALMDDLSETGDGKLVVGFDSEWDVTTGPNERVTGRGPTAVVQIAYKSHVYVLQVRD